MIIEAFVVTNTIIINNIIIVATNRQEAPTVDINFINYIIKHKDLNYTASAIIVINDSSFYNYSLYQFLIVKGANFVLPIRPIIIKSATMVQLIAK